MTRYTDRDCYAALVRAAASLNSAGHDYGVEFTSKASWSEKLEEMAVRMRVPIRRWGTAACSEGPRLVLDHAPSCYLPGDVREMWRRRYSADDRGFLTVADMAAAGGDR